MVKYKVFSREDGYTGISAGISFLNGEGVTDNKNIADWHERKGYKVEKINEETEEDINLVDLTVEKLKEIASEKGIEVKSSMKKNEIISLLGEDYGE